MGFWDGVFFGIVSWIVFVWLLRMFVTSLILKEVDKEISKIKEATGEILLKVEKHGSVLYCYRKDNDEFVGQGSSLEELYEIFKKRYPNNSGKILKEDLPSGML